MIRSRHPAYAGDSPVFRSVFLHLLHRVEIRLCSGGQTVERPVGPQKIFAFAFDLNPVLPAARAEPGLAMATAVIEELHQDFGVTSFFVTEGLDSSPERGLEFTVRSAFAQQSVFQLAKNAQGAVSQRVKEG